MKHLLRVTAIGLFLLVMIVPSSRGTAGPPPKDGDETPPVIMWEPADPNAWTIGGRAQVASIIERMQAIIHKIPPAGLVAPETIKLIAGLYGDNGVLTGYDGTTYRGAREIAMYFRQLALCRTLANLKLEIKFVYAMEFTEKARDAGGKPEDIVHSLYFILACSYLIDAHPVFALSSTSCPHSRMCECNSGK